MDFPMASEMLPPLETAHTDSPTALSESAGIFGRLLFSNMVDGQYFAGLTVRICRPEALIELLSRLVLDEIISDTP